MSEIRSSRTPFGAFAGTLFKSAAAARTSFQLLGFLVPSNEFKWLQNYQITSMTINCNYIITSISANTINMNYLLWWLRNFGKRMFPKGRAEACDEFLASAIDVYQYLQQELMAADQIGHLEDVFSKATWKQCGNGLKPWHLVNIKINGKWVFIHPNMAP